jgi:predicted ArsR family transcriptional regulator
MLAEAIEEDPDHGAEGAADELARAKGRSEGRQARAKSRARQLRAGLIELLGEVGYQPTTTPEGTIRLQNCPYHDLAANHRDLTCGMNLAWARGVLEGLAGAPAAGPSAADPGAGDRAGQLEANLAPEPGYCCVVFSEPNPTESDRSDS